MSHLKTIDLFAGLGGIRLGFHSAGFTTVYANDFDARAKQTYDENFKDVKLTLQDITTVETKTIPKFDILLGGFPCQAFSIAGHRHGFQDEKGRGNLFFDIARILRDKKPMGFLLENVKNLKGHDGGNTFAVITKELDDLGYDIKYQILNTMEYGNTPQNRERIYIVGFKKELGIIDKFEFPEKIPLTRSVIDLLQHPTDIPDKYYYNGTPLYERIKDYPFEKNRVYQWRRQYIRENKKGVCPTLTANMGMGGHNVPIVKDARGIRKLTPRECARIQGYKDTYLFPPGLLDLHLYKQIGNSVSVPVIERIAKQMKKAIDQK